MCGIVAAFSERATDSQVLDQMLKAVRKRGDAAPTWRKWHGACLGMVRLMIVDRENGEQPVLNEDDTIAVVFNGEIYNHHVLREDLICRGHSFKTTCDTEVLVHLYEEYGEKMVHHLEGMFAFVIYDIREDCFFAARDKMGIKPLYYCQINHDLYFASELSAFYHLEADEYQEIPPASYMTKEGLCRYHRYQTSPLVTDDFTTAKAIVRAIVERAVKKRVDTDLPIGVFLSGGLDSSIVYLLSLKYHPDTIAIVIGDDDAEDVRYAIRLCELHGQKYIHLKYDKSELLSKIPEVIQAIGTFEINVVRGSTLSYLLSEAAAKNGLKLVICGEGSDEIFAGYGDFLHAKEQTAFDKKTMGFLDSLYRTQLLRIDRTGMAFGVEVREPFMDHVLIDYAIRLPMSYKINLIGGQRLTTKYILREAFRDLLPEEIYLRDKMTLMEGAGAGPVNKDRGMFFDFAAGKVSEEDLIKFQQDFPEYRLESREAAYYFELFMKHYAKAGFARERTFNAVVEIKK